MMAKFTGLKCVDIAYKEKLFLNYVLLGTQKNPIQLLFWNVL